MVVIRKKGLLYYLFRAPIYLFRWRMGWLLGKRLMLLQHKGRRTGRTRRTVLEVVEYREQGPEVVVANGFRDSDWVLNLQANSDAAVSVGGRHFAASYRTLAEDEAAEVIERYERRNRLIAPVVRAGFTWLLGWKYNSTEKERRRLVQQIPLLAFWPRS